MSGGGNKKRSSGRSQGWEEAGGEFYTESYPSGTEIDMDIIQKDASRLATLLPSKQSRYATIRTTTTRYTDTRTRTFHKTGTRSWQSTARRASTFNQDIQVAMLPDLSENLSNEESTWHEILQIKSLPISMMQKKELKAKLQNATYLRLQGFKRFKWRMCKKWQKYRVRWCEFITHLQLWSGNFKAIESQVGTGTVSYFLFIKWLMFFNLKLFLPVLLFIILPKILLYETNGETACNFTNHNSTHTKNNGLLEHSFNDSQCCKSIYYNESNFLFINVYDILRMHGWLEYTVGFYGAFTNEIIQIFPSNGLAVNTTDESEINLTNTTRSNNTTDAIGAQNGVFTKLEYDPTFVYSFTILLVFSLSFLLIIRTALHGFKLKLIQSQGYVYNYCNTIFSGWDFCIKNEEVAQVKHDSLYWEIRNLIHIERVEEDRMNRTGKKTLKLFFCRLFLNCVFGFILIFSGSLVYIIIQLSNSQLENSYQSVSVNAQLNSISESQISEETDNESQNNRLSVNSLIEDNIFSQILLIIFEYSPYLLIVLFNIITPNIFRFLIKYERYSSSFSSKILLLRMILLRITLLSILLVTLYDQINCLDTFSSTPRAANSTKPCHQNCTPSPCWETYIARQIYKLILSDLTVNLLTTFFINFPRAFLARHISNKCIRYFGEQKFILSEQLLDIVYIQVLTWIGLFYAPLLPLVTFFTLFVLFYLKRFVCLHNCKQNYIENYKASTAFYMYRLVLSISFVVFVGVVLYAVIILPVSKSCGPFGDYSTIWSYFRGLLDDLPGYVHDNVVIFKSYSFFVPIFLILLLVLYYLYVINQANKEMVGVLRNQLILEGHDKQFLLDRLTAFIKQQQDYQKKMRNLEILRERDRMHNSST